MQSRTGTRGNMTGVIRVLTHCAYRINISRVDYFQLPNCLVNCYIPKQLASSLELSILAKRKKKKQRQI